MLADQFHQATAGARTFPQLEEISRLIWRAHAKGHLADADATAVAEAIQARRGALEGCHSPKPFSASVGPPSAPGRPTVRRA
jgi:hypothetical protein